MNPIFNIFRATEAPIADNREQLGWNARVVARAAAPKEGGGFAQDRFVRAAMTDDVPSLVIKKSVGQYPELLHVIADRIAIGDYPAGTVVDLYDGRQVIEGQVIYVDSGDMATRGGQGER